MRALRTTNQAIADWKRTRWIKKGTAVKLPFDVDYFYRIDDNKTYVYCQATKSFMDILVSLFVLLVRSVKDGAVRYHPGYYGSAKAIMEDLRDRNISTKLIELYGYSLGGAISCIMNDKYLARGRKIDRHVTFGAPASGRGKALYDLRKNTIRYVQGFDIVPVCMFMYKHYGNLHKLPSRGNIKENHLYYWM